MKKRGFPSRLDFGLCLWHFTLASLAICDIVLCFDSVKRGWAGTELPDTCVVNDNPFPNANDNEEQNSCSRSSSYTWIIGPLFSFLCLIEAFRLARQRRREAYESAALDVFEKKLATICTTARCSILGVGGGNSNEHIQQDLDRELARKTLRIWFPVAQVLLLWLGLIPLTFNSTQCGTHDTAIASLIVTQTFGHWDQAQAAGLALAKSWAVRTVRRDFLQRPLLLWKRIRKLMRTIRFLRFAGPILRILDKLQAHVRDLASSLKQLFLARAHKMKRIRRKSLMHEDIRRIASIEKFQAVLRTAKSQVFNLAPESYKNALQGSIGHKLKTEKYSRLHREKKVDMLMARMNNSSSNLGDLYDQIVDITQEVTTTVQRSVLQKHLIPPNSRFALTWRTIVSMCLVLALLRLHWSWQIAGNFDVPHSEVLRQSAAAAWCVDDNTARGFALFRFTGNLTRKIMQKKPPQNCSDTNFVPILASKVGVWLQQLIDIVCFFDIFVWYYTGEVSEAGVVVPKPFFSRCILPGTLVQIFDHPTLPTILPNLIARLLKVAESVGYARVARWVIVIVQALDVLVVGPSRRWFLLPSASSLLMGGEDLHYSGSFVY